MDKRIERARELLKKLNSGRGESQFEQARRFLMIQESLRELNKLKIIA